jgi:hypothetical protein
MTKSNYTELEHKYWVVFQILGPYFNQDYDSFQDGVKEYLKNSTQAKSEGLLKIKEFLATDELTDKEKIKFIEDHVQLNFEYFNLEPLSWLEDFARKIEENLQAEKNSSSND